MITNAQTKFINGLALRLNNYGYEAFELIGDLVYENEELTKSEASELIQLLKNESR